MAFPPTHASGPSVRIAWDATKVQPGILSLKQIESGSEMTSPDEIISTL